MSLFPAYASGPDTDGDGACSLPEEDRMRNSQSSSIVLERAEEAREAVLLASDSSEEEPPPAVAPAPPSDDFYLDGKADNANLGVTTLYYPGRPIYKRANIPALGGAGGACGDSGLGARRRRYFLQRPPSPAPAGPQAAERARALRLLLDGSPRDEDLWLRYIDFQEEWADGAAWRAACEEAIARGAGGARLRSALHRARAATLPPAGLLRALAADIADEKRPEPLLEGWLRLLWTLSASSSASEVQLAALAALQALPHSARAYPLALYAYGSSLRAAGLWEQLVLLLELVCAVNFPPAAGFPPPAPPAEEALAAERRLQDAEDAVIDSGLPLSTVWVRVERLRAAAHWRPLARAHAQAQADPQRAPAAADVQELLRAVRAGGAALLCASLLRLARAPLLPASEALRRAAGAGGGGGAQEPGECAGAALCALHRARRRLQPAAPGALRAALAPLLDPPHCFSDDAGYLSWVRALWDACCGWTAGARRLALLCWRLRWLHALALAAPDAEARRLRAEARRALKRHAPREPVAFALFARLEADAGGPAASEAARRAALQAVRASAGVPEVPREHALFAARVLRELVGAREPALAQWALCAAAGGRALPPDAELAAAPPPARLAEALLECTRRCEELERRFEAAPREEEEEPDAALARALTCGAGEWAAARVELLPPRARRDELARLLAEGHARIHRSAETLQYWEACACALALAAAREARRADAARSLQPLFPNNALLALASSGSGVGCARAARTQTGALAQVLPPLLRWPGPAGARRVARAAARAGARGAGGPALCALRLECEPQPHRLLLAALADHPNCKWLYVRGAAWVGAEADALCDALLERGLRAHALLHELRPRSPRHTD